MGSYLRANGWPSLSEQEQQLEAVREDLPSFGAVAPDEIAFALTFFVGSATRRTGLLKLPATKTEERSFARCRQLFRLISAHTTTSAASQPSRGDTRSLPEAFWSLWQSHEGHPDRSSICSRVLGFYLLTERSAGASLQPWLEPCPEDSSLVHLRPCVVEALASVSLGAYGQLSEQPFLALVHTLGRQ